MISDQVFWDRLQDMPLAEAEQELVLRREENALVLAMLQKEKSEAKNKFIEKDIGNEIFNVMSQMTKINERIKYLRKLQDKVTWKNAVRALYGQDAVEECVIWIETNGRAEA